MAETSYALPVYRTWPDKEYEVKGSLRHDDPNKVWNDGEIQGAAREAKKHGGGAIILRYGAEDAVLGLANVQPLGVTFRSMTSALVIRFLTPQEIATRSALQKELLQDYLINNPKIACSEETSWLVFKYLLQNGGTPTNANFVKLFQETMGRISSGGGDALAGEWVFKASLKTATITSSDEHNFLGIATVRDADGTIGILSKEGNVEFSFAGKRVSGGLEGQVGIRGFSAHGEGVALPEKISLTFQSVLQSGTAQGTIILQRANGHSASAPNSTNKSI